VLKTLLLVDSRRENATRGGEGISLQKFLASIVSVASNVLVWRSYVVVSNFTIWRACWAQF
jgi:hypothetical protein